MVWPLHLGAADSFINPEANKKIQTKRAGGQSHPPFLHLGSEILISFAPRFSLGRMR
jgi:hypothetical protein